jgi:putative ABC transport system permease protein
MFRISLKSLWSHKRRLISTCISVILGVAFMAGTFVLTATINRGFDDLFATGFDGTDAVVRGPVLYKDTQQGGTQRDLFSEDAVAKVQAVDGVAVADGAISTTTISVIDSKGDPMGGAGPPTIFGAWLPDPKLNPYHVVEGHAPATASEITMNKAAVDKGDLVLGRDVKLVTPKGNRFFKLVGITKFGDADSSGGVVGVQTTLAGAQDVIGEKGRLESIVVRAKPGVSPDQLVRNIEKARVAQGADVVTGEQAAAELSQELKGGFVKFFSTLLLIFAAVALFVGAFIISNTFGILVAQRTKELALLRAIGASRPQVLASVLLEATAIGLFSSIVGLVAGIGLGSGALKLLAGFGIDLPSSGVTPSARDALITLAVGLGITGISSVMPAIRATRVPPVAAMRDVAVDTTGRNLARPIIGGVVLVLGALSIIPAFGADPSTDVTPKVGLGLGLIIVSVLMLAPTFAQPLSWLVGLPLPAIRGITGRLARENAMRSPRRTASTASALIIGVTLIVFITAFAASAQASFSHTIDGGFRGDYIVQPLQQGQPIGVSPKIVTQLRAVDGVDTVAPASFLGTQATLPDGSKMGAFVGGVDPKTYERVFAVKMTLGSLKDLHDGEVLVDRQIAKKHGLRVGQRVSLLAGQGGRQATLKIVGISNDPVLLGNWTLTRGQTAKLSPKPTVSFVGIRLDAGRTVDSMRKPLKAVVGQYPTMKLQDRDQFLGSIVDTLSTLLLVIYALLLLSVLIALIGIANTLSLSIHERTRELGLLRAMGMTRSQLKSSIRWEAAIVALLGTTVGVVLGIGASITLVKALKNFGISEFQLPIVSLVPIVVASLALGVLAAALPARRAAKLNVLEAIATE